MFQAKKVYVTLLVLAAIALFFLNRQAQNQAATPPAEIKRHVAQENYSSSTQAPDSQITKIESRALTTSAETQMKTLIRERLNVIKVRSLYKRPPSRQQITKDLVALDENLKESSQWKLVQNLRADGRISASPDALFQVAGYAIKPRESQNSLNPMSVVYDSRTSLYGVVTGTLVATFKSLEALDHLSKDFVIEDVAPNIKTAFIKPTSQPLLAAYKVLKSHALISSVRIEIISRRPEKN